MEIRRFGVGHRRQVGPPGTEGVEGVVLHSDARATISELAFAKGGSVPVHGSPNTTWFIVIEGGGYVLVGEEERRIAAGEAVLWPADIVHGARTVYGPMRALVVEIQGADDSDARRVLDGIARRLGPGEGGTVSKGEGHLAPRPLSVPRDPEGEPA